MSLDNFFNKVETEEVEINEYEDEYPEYDTLYINDFGDGDTFKGEPRMSEIYEKTFEDKFTGQEITQNNIKLKVINHEDEEVFEAGIKLKTNADVQDIWKKSKLGSFIWSVAEVNGTPIKGNKLTNFNIKEFSEEINNMSNINIVIVSDEFENRSGEIIEYNLVKVTQIN